VTLNPQDFVDIDQLYARQSQAIDVGDAAGWADTFTENGTFESPTYGQTVSGRVELAAFAQRFADTAAAEGRSYRHWTNSIVLNAEGENRVTASGYLAIVSIEPQAPPRFERHVEISDQLARTAAGWRFRSRVVAPSSQGSNPKEH
jgi:hypothetical protein